MQFISDLSLIEFSAQLTLTCESVLVFMLALSVPAFVLGSKVTGVRLSTDANHTACASQAVFIQLSYMEIMIMRVINPKSWLNGRVDFLTEEIAKAEAAKAEVRRYRKMRGCPRNWWRNVRRTLITLKRALAETKAQLETLASTKVSETQQAGFMKVIEAKTLVASGLPSNFNPMTMTEEAFNALFSSIMDEVDSSNGQALFFAEFPKLKTFNNMEDYFAESTITTASKMAGGGYVNA